jgi:hypothetical protein
MNVEPWTDRETRRPALCSSEREFRVHDTIIPRLSLGTHLKRPVTPFVLIWLRYIGTMLKCAPKVFYMQEAVNETAERSQKVRVPL